MPVLALFGLFALIVSGLALPAPQFNPVTALPAIPGAPALDSAGWSLEGGTAMSSAFSPMTTSQDSAPDQLLRLTTTASLLPATGSELFATAPTSMQGASVVLPIQPTLIDAISTQVASTLEPFTTLSNDPQAGVTPGVPAGEGLSPTPTVPGPASSTRATLDPSAASAMAEILSGLGSLQDATGLQEGATSSEDPSSGSKAQADQPALPQPGPAASSAVA
ncbi:hypothetical protein BMF94_0781 [Rhodotorula taiwanensis]|uniref:Uncharacterized protein n=1 Tax=Rhodotorula taiwanensis TaxID=741276 RepID=A0A2S5BH02_9BASI|nr:hypothetical protein BMF94_0781 [Rhodotorula taiwanensis]